MYECVYARIDANASLYMYNRWGWREDRHRGDRWHWVDGQIDFYIIECLYSLPYKM